MFVEDLAVLSLEGVLLMTLKEGGGTVGYLYWLMTTPELNYVIDNHLPPCLIKHSNSKLSKNLFILKKFHIMHREESSTTFQILLIKHSLRECRQK